MGDIKPGDIDEGEPGRRFKAAAMSMTVAPAAVDLGDGTAEPVET